VLPAIFIPRISERFFRRAESIFSRFAAHKLLTVVALFLVVIALRLALLGGFPFPIPAFMTSSLPAHG